MQFEPLSLPAAPPRTLRLVPQILEAGNLFPDDDASETPGPPDLRVADSIALTRSLSEASSRFAFVKLI